VSLSTFITLKLNFLMLSLSSQHIKNMKNSSTLFSIRIYCSAAFTIIRLKFIFCRMVTARKCQHICYFNIKPNTAIFRIAMYSSVVRTNVIILSLPKVITGTNRFGCTIICKQKVNYALQKLKVCDKYVSIHY
jgi:hypothetical protein